MSRLSAYRHLDNGLGRVASAASNVGAALTGDAVGGPWHRRLSQASFRGVPFGVITAESDFGRRVAVHTYPFRDSVWVEDLGRSARRISLVGFLIGPSAVYGGGDAKAQRDRLVKACETAGEGELVHPTLGRKSVALLRFHVSESRDHGGAFEVFFSFVEAGKLQYPNSSSAFADAIKALADDLGITAALDFAREVGEALQAGAAVVRDVLNTVSNVVGTVLNVVTDATSLFNSLVAIPGEIGRFAGTVTRRQSSVTAIQPVTTSRSTATRETMTALKASTAARRAKVAQTCFTATTAAAGITASNAEAVALVIIIVVRDFAASLAGPADVLRLLPRLATVGASGSPGAVAVTALVRRAALIEITKAAAGYQPTSYDDAVEVRRRVCDLLEAEMVRAGDAGQDDTYLALRGLRTAVSADLTERGASLARKVVVTTASPQPALVLAHRLYQDPDRTAELVDEANPTHPAFMPIKFLALSE